MKSRVKYPSSPSRSSARVTCSRGLDVAAEALHVAPAETLVFEDSLYALKTAKAAGFYTIGVYDADGETDQAGLQMAADLYVRDLHEAVLL